MDIDKDLRRNMKHVHNSYLFHCEHCGFEDDIYVGVGMMSSIVYDEIIEKNRIRILRRKMEDLICEQPKDHR